MISYNIIYIYHIIYHIIYHTIPNNIPHNIPYNIPLTVGAISATPIVHWHGLQLRRLHLEALKVSQSQHSEALHHGLSQHQVGGTGNEKKKNENRLDGTGSMCFISIYFRRNKVYAS